MALRTSAGSSLSCHLKWAEAGRRRCCGPSARQLRCRFWNGFCGRDSVCVYAGGVQPGGSQSRIAGNFNRDREHFNWLFGKRQPHLHTDLVANRGNGSAHLFKRLGGDARRYHDNWDCHSYGKLDWTRQCPGATRRRWHGPGLGSRRRRSSGVCLISGNSGASA